MRIIAYVDTPSELRTALRNDLARQLIDMRQEQLRITGVRNSAVIAARITTIESVITLLDMIQIRPACQQPGRDMITKE